MPLSVFHGIPPAALCLFLLPLVQPGPAGAGASSASVAGHPQAAKSAQARALDDWVGAVWRHEPRLADAPVREIAAWPEADLSAVVGEVSALAEFLARAQTRFARSGQLSTFNYRRRPWAVPEIAKLLGLSDAEAVQADVSRLVMRAVLLHTDAAILVDSHPDDARRPAGSGMHGALLVQDGQHIGSVDRGPHWHLARRLLALPALPASSDDLARRWYIAAAAYMHSQSLIADVQPHLSSGLTRFPGDPDLLFRRGAMLETMAAPHVQRAVDGFPAMWRLDGTPRSSIDSGGRVEVTKVARPGIADARTHVVEAEKHFRRALKAAPDLVEGRIRLGRVLALLGRHEEAAVELERALPAAHGPALEYYAALLLGGVHSRLGRVDEAREAYRRAAALYPRAQSPRLGLSSLAAGREAASSPLVEALAFPEDHPSRYDPWWDYYTGTGIEAEALLAAWRQAVVEEAPR